ncbi:hypothetical protein [Rhodobaculum claviforme]|uniref:Uncharacterized protein n=1 Tax=Rhodobaculum claviforme TaxID=1549854 RepID=A0A934TMB5_9RHOB|nr:hypothetical protein [Rhodobaculum claviforme]MBK5928420.1 hypothetical protein [Rhodobaculum claviforme]
MLRLFSLFGRSADLNALDDALRGCGVHPILVPEAVKLTVLRLRKGAVAGATPAHAATAELLAYCILGPETFAEANGPGAGDRADARLEAAIAAGDTFDARLVLLTLHAGLVAPDIADRIEVEDR